MKDIYDIIIIGGGTAGMTAAIYGYRAGKNILIIEKSVYGGQIISTSELENYPGFTGTSGSDFALDLYGQIKDMDIDRVTDEVQGLVKSVALQKIPANERTWCVSCRKGSYLGKTVIIAVGTNNRKPGLAEEDVYLGHGLSYCATCDGALHKNKRVAVVGGGNTALEDALYLSLLCDSIYLIHRSDKFTGDNKLQQRIKKSANIIIMLNTEVTALHGKDKLEEIELDHSKRLAVSALFIAIGRTPQNQPFADIVSLDDKGYILAGENCHTNIPGIFAAGDCRTKDLRQLVTAAADGATAATEACKSL